MKLSSFLIPGILITMTIAAPSCSKSGSSGKPKISIKSINTTIQPGEDLDADLNFTNANDLAQGTLVVIRIRTNQIPPQNPIGGDTIFAILPSYGGVDKGELEYTQPYQGYLHFDDHINDTLIFKFAVIDASNHSSDTISSPKVIALSP